MADDGDDAKLAPDDAGDDDLNTEHAPEAARLSPIPHAARPAHFATVEAYRALGRHIVAMGDLVLRNPWDDAELAAMDREVCRLAHDIEQAKERMLLLRACQGAMH